MSSGRMIPRGNLPNHREGDRRRDGKRAPTYGHATYTYMKGPFIYTIEGSIRDLSESGCIIRGTMPEIVGKHMKVVLSLEEEQAPLCMKGAVVSWAHDDCFGVTFPKLKPKQYNQLREYVRKKAA